MSRRIIIYAVAAVLAAWFLAAGTAQAAGGPKLVVDPESFDFGTVDEGDTPKAIFTISNAGDAELLIHDVKRSCGCTVTKLEKKNLAPGESTRLEATYNSKGKRGGRISKTVTIMTNDPDNQSKVVMITGNVKEIPAPILTLNATGLTQLKLVSGQTEHRIVTVGNKGEMDLSISEITAPKNVKINIGDYVINPGQTMLLELVIKPNEVRSMELDISTDGNPPGRFSERITIRSNNKGRPVTPLAVAGTIEPATKK